MKRNRKNTEFRTLIVAAKTISNIFRPVYYPLLCCVILFTFTPLSNLPMEYMVLQLAVIAMFTLLLPVLLTLLYHHILHHDPLQKRLRLNRIGPYLLHILCYVVYLQVMHGVSVPYLILSVIIVTLCIQIACTVISLFWKVSVHMAGAGAIIGAIQAYSFIFRFNPLPWLCLAILMAGLVGTSRMILRQHNLSQLLIGLFIGILCGFVGILQGDIFFAN